MQGPFTVDGLVYLESPSVYRVREDSVLLFRTLQPLFKARRGRFLDIGCGCALNGMAAAREGWEVLMVDREPRALALARRNLGLNGLWARSCLSDLMEGVPSEWLGRFDLAAFNPPYLEMDEDLHPRDQLPLCGRPTPRNLAHRFLEEVGPFMRSGGDVIVLAPGVWDPFLLAKGTLLELRQAKELEDRSTGEPFRALNYGRP